MEEEGDPCLSACIIRDHIKNRSNGVFVSASALGKATIGADCVFSGNNGGDVKRMEF